MDKLTDLKGKKLIIFGGSGFLGSAIVNRALNCEMEVTCVSMKEHKNYFEENPNLKNFFFDIANNPFNMFLEDTFDYAVNCSGYIDHSNFSKDANVIDTHLIGLINIIKNLNPSGIKKFINIGSSDEYGKLGSSGTELQREEPHTPYAFSKTASTHFLQMLNRNINFPGITLRPFLIFGPYQNKERLIPYVIDACRQNTVFEITEGSQLRDFLYITDFVDAVFSSLVSDSKSNGKVFDIGSGIGITVRELAEIIKIKCKGGFPNFGGKRLEKKEPNILVANIELAHELLGWRPKIDISEGLDLTIDSLKS